MSRKKEKQNVREKTKKELKIEQEPWIKWKRHVVFKCNSLYISLILLFVTVICSFEAYFTQTDER